MDLHVLECRDVLFRALIRANHFDRKTRQIMAAAFLLRESESGLSVSFGCSPAACAANFDKCRGVASLLVGHVRDAGLDVVPDEPNHANIIGLPNSTVDPTEAERHARKLLRQARLAWEPGA